MVNIHFNIIEKGQNLSISLLIRIRIKGIPFFNRFKSLLILYYRHQHCDLLYEIYIDGSSRGNPGLSGIGVIAFKKQEDF